MNFPIRCSAEPEQVAAEQGKSLKDFLTETVSDRLHAAKLLDLVEKYGKRLVGAG